MTKYFLMRPNVSFFHTVHCCGVKENSLSLTKCFVKSFRSLHYLISQNFRQNIANVKFCKYYFRTLYNDIFPNLNSYSFFKLNLISRKKNHQTTSQMAILPVISRKITNTAVAEFAISFNWFDGKKFNSLISRKNRM